MGLSDVFVSRVLPASNMQRRLQLENGENIDLHLGIGWIRSRKMCERREINNMEFMSIAVSDMNAFGKKWNKLYSKNKNFEKTNCCAALFSLFLMIEAKRALEMRATTLANQPTSRFFFGISKLLHIIRTQNNLARLAAPSSQNQMRPHKTLAHIRSPPKCKCKHTDTHRNTLPTVPLARTRTPTIAARIPRVFCSLVYIVTLRSASSPTARRSDTHTYALADDNGTNIAYGKACGRSVRDQIMHQWQFITVHDLC